MKADLFILLSNVLPAQEMETHNEGMTSPTGKGNKGAGESPGFAKVIKKGNNIGSGKIHG